MRALAALSRFVGNTFAYWVLIFAVLAFLVSAGYAVRYLRRPGPRFDAVSAESARLGLIFVVLATLSGAVFSKLTWGSYWNWDPRQTTIFVLLLIYAAYLTLRSVIPDAHRRARVAAIYALFSFLTVPFLVFIIPRFYFRCIRHLSSTAAAPSTWTPSCSRRSWRRCWT